MHINCPVPRQGRGKQGRVRGVQGGWVAPWPCAEHIYIDFRAWDWHLGARACVGRQLVVMDFGFSISARFPRLLAHSLSSPLFFFIVFCGCTINWAEIASAKLTVSCTLIDFCSVPGPTGNHRAVRPAPASRVGSVNGTGLGLRMPVGLWQRLRDGCERWCGCGALSPLDWGFLIMAKGALAAA